MWRQYSLLGWSSCLVTDWEFGLQINYDWKNSRTGRLRKLVSEKNYQKKNSAMIIQVLKKSIGMLPPTPSFATIAGILGRGNSPTNSSPPHPGDLENSYWKPPPFFRNFLLVLVGVLFFKIWWVSYPNHNKTHPNHLSKPHPFGPIVSGFPTHEETKLPERL